MLAMDVGAIDVCFLINRHDPSIEIVEVEGETRPKTRQATPPYTFEPLFNSLLSHKTPS